MLFGTETLFDQWFEELLLIGKRCILLLTWSRQIVSASRVRELTVYKFCSNGKTNGITLPNAGGQEAVIRKAYKKAGLGLDETYYVEVILPGQHSSAQQRAHLCEAISLAQYLLTLSIILGSWDRDTRW